MGSVINCEPKSKGWWGRNWIWLAILAVVIVWAITPLLALLVVAVAERKFGPDTFAGAGQFGDQFGAVNALFSAMTVVLVFIAFWGEKEDRKQAEERWRRERADAGVERRQAEERWRQEQSDAQRAQELAEIDRRVRYFFDALARFSSERSAIHIALPQFGTPRGGPVRVTGRSAIGHTADVLDQRLNAEPSAYLADETDEARIEFSRRVTAWYSEFASDLLGPMLAHVGTMQWSLRFVDRLDEDSASMLKRAIRKTMTVDDLRVLIAVATIESDIRMFITSAYLKHDCLVPYPEHFTDWIWTAEWEEHD